MTLLLDGFFYGEDAAATMEALRSAQAKAKPLSFAADIAVGTELTDVIIETFRVRQVAGYRTRFRFTLRVREFIDPPEPVSAGSSAVGRLAQDDAAAWGADHLAAARVLQDPASLPVAMSGHPGVLDALDMDDMAGALTNNLDAMSSDQLDGVFGSIAAADPGKADRLFGKLKDAGALGGVLSRYLDEGATFMKGVDPRRLIGVVKAFGSGLDFLQQMLRVAQASMRLVDSIRRLEVPRAIARHLPASAPPQGGGS